LFSKARTSDGSSSGTLVLVKGRVLLAFSHTLFSKQSSAVITVSLMLTERIRWKTAYGLNGDSSLKIKAS